MKVKQKGRGITSSRPRITKEYILNRVNNSNRPNQSRKGYYWTEPENRGLLENIKSGKSVNNISKKHKRSKGAITARLLKLIPSHTKNHTPTRKYHRWNSNEDKTLLESIKELGINNIAKTHNRTRGAITARLQKTPPITASLQKTTPITASLQKTPPITSSLQRPLIVVKAKSYARELGQPLNEWLADTHANIKSHTVSAIKTKKHRNVSNAAYRGLSLSTLYDSDWKIPVEDQHKLIDLSIAKQKLRFHNVDRYDFTKPMDVNFIYDKQMVLLQDIDVEKVITLLNDPDVTSLLFLQPNLG